MPEREAWKGPEFHLAIVGGCMTHQPGIPFNSLYHRRIARRVASEAGIRIRPHIARGFGQDYADRLEALLERHDIDGVLLHLRVLIMRRARLLVQGPAGGARYSLHPAFLRRQHSGAAVEALRSAETAARRDGTRGDDVVQIHERPRGRLETFRPRNLNWALGAAAGLDRWAVEDEMLRLAEFEQLCQKRQLPLFVLGPTPLLGRYWQSRCIGLLNERIRRWASERGTPSAVIGEVADSEGHPLVKSDGVHLTVAGHAHVAELLYHRGLASWVTQHARGGAAKDARQTMAR